MAAEIEPGGAPGRYHVETSPTTSLPFPGAKAPGPEKPASAITRRGGVEFLGRRDRDLRPVSEENRDAKAVQSELIEILQQLHPDLLMSSRCRHIIWRPKQVLDDIQRQLDPKLGTTPPACPTRDIRRNLYRVLMTTRDRHLQNKAISLWLAFDLAPPDEHEGRLVPRLAALYPRRTSSSHPPEKKKETHFSIEAFGSLSWLWLMAHERSLKADLAPPGLILAWRSEGIEANISIQFTLNTIFSQVGIRFYSFRNRRFRISHSVGLGLAAGPWFVAPEDDEDFLILPWATGSPVELWFRFYKGLWFHVAPVRIHPFFLIGVAIMSDCGLRWEF